MVMRDTCKAVNQQGELQTITTEDLIQELFCRAAEAMPEVERHPQARLTPSELVVIAFLFVLQGRGQRAFSRWLKRDGQGCFPNA